MADYKDSLIYEVEISDDSLDTITAKVAKATAVGIAQGSSGIGGGASPGAPGGGTVRGGFGSTGASSNTAAGNASFMRAVAEFSASVKAHAATMAKHAAPGGGGGSGGGRGGGPGHIPSRGGRGYTFGFGSGRNTPWGQFAASGGAALGGPGGMLGRFAGYAMGNYPSGRQMVQQRRQYMATHGMANTAANRRAAGGAVGRAAMGQSVRAGIGGAIGGNAGAALMAGGGAMGTLAVSTLGVVAGMKMLVDTLGKYNATTMQAMIGLEIATMKMKRALSAVLEPLMTAFTKILTKLADGVTRLADMIVGADKKINGMGGFQDDGPHGMGMQDRGIRKRNQRPNFNGNIGLNPKILVGPNAMGGAINEQLQGRARGGYILGSGTDTVPAMLTPGEFVMNRRSAQQFGPQLMAMNHMAGGGWVKNHRPHEIMRDDTYHAPDPNSRGHGYLKSPVSAYSYLHRKKKEIDPADLALKVRNIVWGQNKLLNLFGGAIAPDLAAGGNPLGAVDAAKKNLAGLGLDPLPDNPTVMDINRQKTGAADAGGNGAGGALGPGGQMVAKPPMPTTIPSTSWDGIAQNITVNMESKIMCERMVWQEMMNMRDEIQRQIGTFRDETRLMVGLLDCGLSPGL